MNGLTPQYLVDPVPVPCRHLFGRHATNDLYEFTWRNFRFLHSFYPDSVLSWNNLGPEIRNLETLSDFKKKLLKIIKPHQAQSIFKIHDPDNLKYVYQLRVGLSQLKSHKKNHNFQDTPSDTCQCGTGMETTEHFLLICPNYTRQRETLISTIIPVLNSKNQNLSSLDNEAKVKLLLYGTENVDFSGNKSVLNATINFIRLTERFDQERTFAST